MSRPAKTLRLILGDQLNPQHSWFDQVSPDVTYLIAELKQEAQYCQHHIQKLTGFFLAMAHFADELRATGHQVIHLDLDATGAFSDLPALLDSLTTEHQFTKFEYQTPDEYRLRQQLRQWTTLPSEEIYSEHFLVPFAELQDEFPTDRKLIMEHFYRRMRRRYNLLMEGDKPLGGQWNYDKENRKALPAKEQPPEPMLFSHDASQVIERLDRHHVSYLGTMVDQQLTWPISRAESLLLLEHFIDQGLVHFGRYQDAMTDRSWSLYHSRLSFSLNTKMLHPLEVVEHIIAAATDRSDVNLAQVEGFVRQIIGWREFVRGIYWTRMPQYTDLNALDADRPLPEYYWSGDTNMACMRQAIGQSLDHAYAHHIQRLMVTGNFALLAGIDPDEVDAWYLGIYIDAIEWVEMPNTRGMSQFADGGIIATKPYISSGKYIQRMSDHCKGCYYNVSARHGEKACPFNPLYWHFLERHRATFSGNQRMRMMYANLDRISTEEHQQIMATAEQYLQQLDNL